MKNFVKKPLAMTALMLALGGVANMAHAISTVDGQDVSADKEVLQGGAFKVEFTASPDEIYSGRQSKNITAFILKASDSAEHSGWRLIATGSSKGGYMYDDSGNRVALHNPSWEWSDADSNWYIDDAGSAPVEADLSIYAGDVVSAGTYHFTGRVEEYLS